MVSHGLRRWVTRVLSGVALLGLSTAAMAVDGPYLGVDVGASIPTNINYRAHAEAGVTGNPYAGYMFNDYLGLQGQMHFTTQDVDNHPRRYFPGENEWTTLGGLTAGPRLQIPMGDELELYTTFQGGGFTGLSGRLNGTAPGFSLGGGFDYYLTEHIAVGLFGRWNRAYMSPHPTQLQYLAADQQGPSDIRWATGGIGLKYRFNAPDHSIAKAPPPPAPAPAVVPPPPAKKKIILRGVNFDTNKAVIRKDAALILDEAALVLGSEKTVGVQVVGHTDSRASDAYNLTLSERRAEAVRDYLVKRKIGAARLTTKGMGESQPVASNDSDEGMAQNRRVELLVE